MPTVDPKVTLIGLIQLQRLDADVWRMRRRIAEGPQLLERRSDRLKGAEQKVGALQAKTLDLKKQAGALELEVKTKETEIAKIQGAQGQSRTNEEFRAFGDHIQRLKKEARAFEDRILDLMGQIEQIEQDASELKRTRDALKAESDENIAQWKQDAAEYEVELAATLERRAEFAKSLLPGPLSVYERVLKARDGKAVVPADGKVCGGCQMAITPNDFTRLHRMSELVTCRSCERILFLPDLVKAAT